MSIVKGFMQGMISAFTVTTPPLYRYPYRNASEAFRGDSKQIARDIEAVLNELDEEGQIRDEHQ